MGPAQLPLVNISLPRTPIVRNATTVPLIEQEMVVDGLLIRNASEEHFIPSNHSSFIDFLGEERDAVGLLSQR